MHKIILLLFIFYFWSDYNAQKIEALSSTISLNVSYRPPDQIPPSVQVIKPIRNLINSLPIYTKDSILTFQGNWTDNIDEEIYLTINDSLLYTFSEKNFEFSIKLTKGRSVFNLSFEDYSKNSTKTSYMIERNETIDINPPKIVLIKPNSENIFLSNYEHIQDSLIEDRFEVRGMLIEESGIYSFSINDVEIPLDSNFVFHWEPNIIPESLNIKAIDNYGNLGVKELVFRFPKEIIEE